MRNTYYQRTERRIRRLRHALVEVAEYTFGGCQICAAAERIARKALKNDDRAEDRNRATE